MKADSVNSHRNPVRVRKTQGDSSNGIAFCIQRFQKTWLIELDPSISRFISFDVFFDSDVAWGYAIQIHHQLGR